MKLKRLWLLFTMVLLLCVLSFAVQAEDNTASSLPCSNNITDITFTRPSGSYANRLSILQGTFPEGWYWNNWTTSQLGSAQQRNITIGNHLTSVSTLACGSTHNDNRYWGAWNGTRNCGFARMMFDLTWNMDTEADSYGYMYSSASRDSFFLDYLSPGDMIFTGSRYYYVTGVSGSTVTYGACNLNGNCQINWNKQITKQALLNEMSNAASSNNISYVCSPIPKAFSSSTFNWDVYEVTSSSLVVKRSPIDNSRIKTSFTLSKGDRFFAASNHLFTDKSGITWTYCKSTENDYGWSRIDNSVVKQLFPPTITTQPTNASVVEGKNVAFSVKASGDDLCYQWQYSTDGSTWKNNSVTTASLSFTAALSQNGVYFRCIVSNGGGSVTSKAVLLTVTMAPPVIVTQPKSISVVENKTATLSVIASGNGLRYQWQYSEDGIIWQNNTVSTATMSFKAKLSHNGYYFRCVVSNDGGSATSKAVLLTVVMAPPVIVTQPESVSVIENKTISFSVEASGSKLNYQWQYSKDGNTWQNKTVTTAGMSFKAKLSHNGNYYRCIVSNDGGSVISKAVLLTVTMAPPVIVNQPKSVSVIENKTIVFSVEASGRNLSYQWEYSKDGNKWQAYTETSAELSIKADIRLNGYYYRCVISNQGGSVISLAVKLTVKEKSGIAINATNFPDANFRKYVKQFDLSGNNDLKQSEIDQVKMIDVSGGKISDLKGIEYFVALTNLNCENNKLTTLDLSKNTKLTGLWCGNNKLRNLDVSNNIKLTYLHCNNNTLISIDVSKNTKLLHLNCSNNQLTILNVSKNTKLKSLDCSNNHLTSLDVSKCSNLNQLSCLNNTLTVTAKDGKVPYSSLPGLKESNLTIIQGARKGKTAFLVDEDMVIYDYKVGNGQTVSFTLNITKNKLISVTLSKTKYPYTGKEIEPKVTVKGSKAENTVTLKKGTDYTVTYENNVNAGTATVTVTGAGKYTGTLTKTFKITRLDISGAKATLKNTSMTYTGKALKPAVTVKIKLDGKTVTLKAGTDYTVKYSNNKKPGTATVIITGKGNFTGTIDLTFKIVKK